MSKTFLQFTLIYKIKKSFIDMQSKSFRNDFPVAYRHKIPRVNPARRNEDSAKISQQVSTQMFSSQFLNENGEKDVSKFYEQHKTRSQVSLIYENRELPRQHETMDIREQSHGSIVLPQNINYRFGGVLNRSSGLINISSKQILKESQSMEPVSWGQTRYGVAKMPEIQSKNALVTPKRSISKQRSEQPNQFKKINDKYKTQYLTQVGDSRVMIPSYNSPKQSELLSASSKIPILKGRNRNFNNTQTIRYLERTTAHILTSTQSRKVYNLIDNAQSSENLKKFKLHEHGFAHSLDRLAAQDEPSDDFKQADTAIDQMSQTQGKFEFKSKLKLASNSNRIPSEEQKLRSHTGLQEQLSQMQQTFALTMANFNKSQASLRSDSLESTGIRVKVNKYTTPRDSKLEIVSKLQNSKRKQEQRFPKSQVKKERIKPRSTFRVGYHPSALMCMKNEEMHTISACDGTSSDSEQSQRDACEDLYHQNTAEQSFVEGEKLKKLKIKKIQAGKRKALLMRKTKITEFQDAIEPDQDPDGIHMQKYFFKSDINKMMNYLEKATGERKELNIIENTIDEVCSKVNQSKDQVRDDISKFHYVNKINMKCIDSKHKPCSVIQRSRAFLYGERFPTVEDYVGLCDHSVSQDEKLMMYIKSYERYAVYKQNLQKCKTDRKAMNVVFGKIHKNPFLQIMQEVHEEEKGNKYNTSNSDHIMSIHSKKGYRLSHSAKKFLKDVRKSVDGEIQEIQNQIDGVRKIEDKAEEEFIPDKTVLIKKLNQLKHMLPSPVLSKNNKDSFYDQLQFLNNKKPQKCNIEMSKRQEIYRLEYIERFLEKRIQNNQQVIKYVDISGLKEAELVERKHHLDEIDEILISSIFDYQDKQQKIVKEYQEFKSNLIVKQKQGSAVTTVEKAPQSPSYVYYDPTTAHELFHDQYNVKTFYNLTKMNQNSPSNQIAFFKDSKWGSTAVQPYYKLIKHNKFKVQGIKLNLAYCKAIANFVMNNQNPHLHILEIHLDDCGMSDDEFAAILSGVVSNSFMKISIQKINYTNNFIGSKSIKLLRQILENQNPIRCLKELNLVKVQHSHSAVANADLALLTQSLVGVELRSLNLSKLDFNVCDVKIVCNLCEFIRQNNNLAVLKLSDCQMNPKQINDILQSVVQKEKIHHLDLSGNVVAGNQTETLKQTIQDIVANLCSLIKKSNGLKILNIKGMGLKSNILPIVDSIKNNHTLSMVNLSSNQLNKLDEEYVNKALNINPPPNMQKLLLDNDKYFQKTWDKFVMQHMDGDSTIEPTLEKWNDRMINQTIMKDLKVQERIEAATINKGMLDEVVKIQNQFHEDMILSRNLYAPDDIYSQIGIHSTEINDFNRPCVWSRSYEKPRDPQNYEYVMVVIDSEDLFKKEFTEIRDKQMIKMFHKMYKLGAIKVKQHSKPIVFGSITNWKPFQALKLIDYVGTVINSKQKERQALQQYLFDDINYDLEEDFKQTWENLFDTFMKIVDEKEPLVIGYEMSKFQAKLPEGKVPLDYHEKQEQQNIFHLSQMKTKSVYTAYALPGKHSIFVFDPNEDKFYFKVFVVEIKSCAEQQKYWIQRQIPVEPIVSKTSTQVSMNPMSFLSDIRPDILDMSSLFQASQDKQKVINFLYQEETRIEVILDSISQNYENICLLYKQLLTENPESYPYLKGKDLDDFFEKNLENRGKDPLDAIEEASLFNRAQFIKNIIIQFKTSAEQTSLDGFVQALIKKSLKQEQQGPFGESKFSKIVYVNKYSIQKFMQKESAIYGLTSKNAIKIVLEKFSDFKMILSYNLLLKYYIQSKEVVQSEQENMGEYNRLNTQELINFIYKISQYIYDPRNYPLKKDGEQDLDSNPMFAESTYVKFREVLTEILDEDMIDPENPDLQQQRKEAKMKMIKKSKSKGKGVKAKEPAKKKK